MKLIKLIIKNSFRHKLRTILTIFGLALTITSFGIVRNILGMFSYSESDIIPGHLVATHATSMMQFLPISHLDKIRQVEGIKYATYGHYVGYRYGENQEEFFVRHAVDPEYYFVLHTDRIMSEETLEAFRAKKNAAVISKTLALENEWEVGKQVTIGCDFFENVNLNVEIVGTFEFGQEEAQQMRFMYIRGDLFRQAIGDSVSAEMKDQAGWFEMVVEDPKDAAEVASRVDSLFMNSENELKTQTVNAMADQQIERYKTIIDALKISSYLMVVVILLVLLNTMIMVARERIKENAVLKTLGFRTSHLATLNFGESIFVALLGGILGSFLIWPGIKLFTVLLPFLRNQVSYNWPTLIWVAIAVVLVGILASILPIYKATKTTIVEGLRTLE